MTTPDGTPRIVCAAVRLKDGLVVCGARHFDSRMRDALCRISTHDMDGTLTGAKQGFIDQYGSFLTREEAWTVAHTNGQIIRDHERCIGTLYSEHLY